jgi:Ricin-type beta-trefoil lectin domain
VVVGLLIGVALSMIGGGPNNSSGNISAAGQATSAPSVDAGSSAPDAVVLPSASSPSASPSGSPSPSPSMSGPTTGNMTFVNVLSGKCMDTAGRVFADGTTEDVYDCNGTPAQTWTVTADGRLTQDGGAYCLDDLGFGNTPGTKVALWTCNGGANQQWTLHPDGSVTSNYANLCLDVTGQGSSDFTPLLLQSCDGNPSQQWTRRQ